MGDEEFRIGIKRFLEKYKYANAVTKDLWKELEAISSTRLNITYIMDTWTRQMGFPVVQVHALTSQTIFFCNLNYSSITKQLIISNSKILGGAGKR